MKHVWPAREARSKFNQVLAQALQEGPQLITKDGKETAIVLSYEEYRKLTLGQKKLTEFFRESPFYGVKLDLARDKSPLRNDVEL